MSILAPARMRLWIEMWKEEVTASIPKDELREKFQQHQIEKGHIPARRPDKIETELEGRKML